MGGFGAIATTIGLVAGAWTLIQGATAKAAKSFDEANAAIQEIDSKYTSNIQNLQALREEYIVLASQTTLTQEEQQRLQTLRERMAAFSPTLRGAIMDETGAWRDQKDTVEALNDELVRLASERDRQLRLAAPDLFVSASGDVEDFQGQMQAIERVDALLSKAADSGQKVWDYVNSLNDGGRGKRSLTSAFESLSNGMGIESPWHGMWSESDVDAALSKYTLLADSYYSTMENDAMSRIDEMKSTLLAFIRQEGFSELGFEMQSYLTQAARDRMASVDWNIWDQGAIKMALASQLQTIYNEAMGQVSVIESMVARLNELARMDTSLLPEPKMGAWITEVNDLMGALNQLLNTMGLPLYAFPEYSEVVMEATEATDELTESLFILSEAQSKLIEDAQKAAAALEADKAAMNGFRYELMGFQQALQNGDLLAYWQNLSEEMRGGMLKAYPELANIILKLSDGELSANEMSGAVENLAEAFDKANKAAMQASFDKYKDAASTIADINSALEQLADSKTAKLFGASDLDSLVGQFPELLTMFGNQAALEEYLVSLKGQQADAQAKAYGDMLINSESYFTYLRTSNSELYQLLS